MRRKYLIINKKHLIFFLFIILSTGCSVFSNVFDKVMKPSPSDFTTAVFDMSYEDTLNAIKNVARNEALPLSLIDKNVGIIESQKILEFNRVRLFRQYIKLHAEIKRLSQNFTSVSINYYISRYDPVTHKWRNIGSTNRQKKFLEKIKLSKETG